MSLMAKVLWKAPKLQFSSFIISPTCHLRYGNDLHRVPSRPSVHQAGCKVVRDASLPLSPILSVFRKKEGRQEHLGPQAHKDTRRSFHWLKSHSLAGKAGTQKHTFAWEHNNSCTHKRMPRSQLLTLAAFNRISLSCSSFLCFSILSSCSKKRSWERTSAVCS